MFRNVLDATAQKVESIFSLDKCRFNLPIACFPEESKLCIESSLRKASTSCFNSTA